jgi:hypothetical protein
MHATIQKPLDEIISYLQKGEKIFIVGCGNCAEKCRSGGEQETQQMKQRLEQKGINVVGAAATGSGKGLCKLALARTLLTVEHKQETDEADSFLVLACGQGIHTVIDATDGADRDCGWVLIFNRLKELGRLEDLYEYREPKNYARSNKPRSLVDIETIPKFKFYGQEYSPVGRNIE